MIPVDKWLSALRSLEGVKMKHRGTSRGQGVDCSGLLIAALGICGVEVKRPFMNGLLPHGQQVTEAMFQFADLTDLCVPGVVIQTFFGKEARHLVVYLGMNEVGQSVIIHAHPKHKMVKISLLTTVPVHLWKLKELQF